MTIVEVLRKVDMLKPNRFTKEQKIGWLDEIERQLWFDVVSTHENPMGIMQRKYDVNSDPDIVLIAPPPYDEVYTLYLQCQIDLGNMEIAKYNNDKTLFNNALMSFRDYWNRTFMPCERAHCFAFDERRRLPMHGYCGQPLFSSADPMDMEYNVHLPPIYAKHKKG